MKFSAAAILAVAAGVQAYSNVTYTTEVVTAVTTYCPAATEVTYGGTTYTVTEATTLTITDCPCTITKALTTSSSKVYANTTVPASKSTQAVLTTSVGTVGVTPTKSATTTLATAGAAKVAGLSGAGLAGMLGVAAAFL